MNADDSFDDEASWRAAISVARGTAGPIHRGARGGGRWRCQEVPCAA